MAIKIPLVADVDAAVRDVGKVGEAFEDVQDALDDVTREAKKTEDALEDVGDGGKKAADSADDMARKFRDDFDKVRKDSKDAGDAIGRNVKDGTDRAGDGMDTFKDEADGTAREAAASFDGSAESIGDVFQELAANAFAGFGPAGAVAGIAAAAGLGIAISKLTEVADKINEAKEAGAEWAQSFNMAAVEDRIQALRDQFDELSATIVDDRQWWELWQEDAVSALDAVVNAQDKAGTSTADFMRAFNELDPTARLDGLRQYREELEKQSEAFDESNKAATDRLNVPEARAWGEKRDAVDGLIEILDTEISKQETANEVEEASRDALRGTVQELQEKNEAIEESNELLEENADANRSAFTAELDLKEQLSETNKVMKDQNATQDERKRSLAELAGQISDTASAEEEAKGTTDAYNRVLRQQRAAFIDAAEAAGYTEEEAADLFRTLVGGPKKKEITVTDNGSAGRTKKELEDVLETAGIKKDMTVGVKANTAQANVDVANFRHAQQSIPVNLQLRAV